MEKSENDILRELAHGKFEDSVDEQTANTTGGSILDVRDSIPESKDLAASC